MNQLLEYKDLITNVFTNKKEKKRKGYYVYMDQHYLVSVCVSEKQFLLWSTLLMPHLNQLKCENFTVSDFEPHTRLERKKKKKSIFLNYKLNPNLVVIIEIYIYIKYFTTTIATSFMF